ncbi:MAG: JAB domain-containing protein, partial [Eudoraea sp.]
LEIGAVSLILVHNHPSGTLKASEADKKITNKLQKASEAMDIRVLDHVIITQNKYYSFADNNLI